MLLKHAEFRNVCQYKKFEVDLKPGLIGIVGPNGIGKSNMVSLWEATLTNDFNFKGRKKEEQIRRGAPESVPSFVRTVWEHDGVELDILRSLRPSKGMLRINGGKPIRKGPLIQRELRAILGSPYDSIQDYVFIKQGQIAKFILEKPADRKESFARLCGAEHIEKLWDALGNQLVADSGLDAQFVDNSVELTTKLDEMHVQLARDQRKLAKRQGQRLPDDETISLQLLVSEVDRLTEKTEELAGAETEANDLAATADRRELKVDRLRADLEEVNRWLEQHLPEYTDAANMRPRVQELQKKAERLEKLKSRVAVKPFDKPQEPEGYETAASLYKQIDKAKLDLSAAEATLEALDAGEVVECPVCHTSVEEVGDHLDACRVVVGALPQLLLRLEPRVELSRTYERDLATWKLDESVRKQAAEAAAEEIESIGKVVVPNAAKLDAVIKQFLLRRETRDDIGAEHRDQTVRLANEHGRLKELRHRVKTLREYITKVRGKQSAAHTAREKLRQSREAEVECGGLERTVADTIQRIEETESQLKQVQALKSRTRKGRKWLAELRSWREVVHRDNFPRIYMASVLEDLVDQVNGLLDEFDGPFHVSAGSDVSFTVHNSDGSSEPAAGKSGGEIVILAIVYLLAANSRFARDIGMMVLDEPSAFLDQKNLGCLANVLRNICEVMQQRQQQLIMITHDQRLERVFNQLIELG